MFQFSPLLSFVSLGFLLLDLLFLWIVNKRRQILNQSLMMVQTRMLSSVMSGVSMMENLRAAGREDSVFLQWTGQLADLNRKQLEFPGFRYLFQSAAFLFECGGQCADSVCRRLADHERRSDSGRHVCVPDTDREFHRPVYGIDDVGSGASDYESRCGAHQRRL